MNNCVKNTLLIGVGAIGGFAACGSIVIKIASKALSNSSELRDYVTRELRRIDAVILGDSRHTEPPNNNPQTNPNREYYPLEESVFIFETRSEVEKIKQDMVKIAGEYGFATLEDFCELAGKEYKYTAAKYGWTYEELQNAGEQLLMSGDAYEIILPKPRLVEFL